MKQNRTSRLNRQALTLMQLNNWHKRFWRAQSKLADNRISDETIFTLATVDMYSETVRGVPLRQKKSIEQALEDAHHAQRFVRSEFSRRGGKTPGCDVLQSMIEKIVTGNPRMSERQLFHELTRQQVNGTVTSIDREADVRAGEPRMIHFVSNDATLKRAPLSGLKDRLYRAKKKIKSR